MTQLERERTAARPLRSVALAATVLLVLAGPAAAEPLRCQREIVKASAKLAQLTFKLLHKCEDAVVRGRSAGPCPDPSTELKLGKAESKLRGAIAKRCGGADRACGTADDESLAAIGWDLGACPGFEDADCDDPIDHCGHVADCLACVGRAAVDQAIDLSYGALVPSGNATVVRCQRSLGKEVQKLFDAKIKALGKCWDDVLKGKTAGPCPDARASAKIARAESKRVDRLCKACGGPDRACGVGADDLAPGEVGFAASCPDVTVPGGEACGGPIDDMLDVVHCLGCVARFKTDCVDAAAVPGLKAFPPECGGATAPTPTPTLTPTPTPTPLCGNGTLEPGETCDGTDDAACPGACRTDCTCPAPCTLPSPLPEVLSFVARSGIDLDTGWTGIAHDGRGTTDGALIAARVDNCDTDLESPTCGQCELDGPVRFPGPTRNCRCYNVGAPDGSSLATCDPEQPADCAAPETCECFYGPPLPLSSGGVPVCVINRSTGAFTGTSNVALTGPRAGEGEAVVRLEASVHNGLLVEQPCPTCEDDAVPRDGVPDGTCNGGPRDGEPCDVSATNELFGEVSFDCPPASAGNIGKLDIVFDTATTGTTTLATGPACTAPGFGTLTCFCDTCATAAGEPCNSDADCPGGATCGGRRCQGGSIPGTPCTINADCPGGTCGRPGKATAPNECDDAVCSPAPGDPDGPNEGVCEAGPNDGRCSAEPFRGCTGNADCNPPPSGNCGSCAPGQTCNSAARQCFLDPIVRTGTPGVDVGVVAATFCIPPTTSSSVNSVAGLPGPGALLQATRFFRSGALCGNGALDAGEACDPPFDAACPGACRIDCRCPGAATCGDGEVNQPFEECDGADDAACPGACESDCTCGPFCGDGAINRPGEECDGADDAACPGECEPTCLCPICGDGTVNLPGEECDGADDAACPGACESDCTCGPFCGDGVVNQPSEECDGADTGVCPGTCEADCTCAPFCGDNVREGAELCDGTDDAACPSECQTDCTCPAIGELAFIVEPGADLDTGWTGTSHDFSIQAGARIDGVLGGCDAVTDLECTYFGNVGSFCSGDASRNCTANTECALGQSCVIKTYGPPLPLSSGGVPVCVVNIFAQDVTGTYRLDTGDSALTARLRSIVHLSADVSRPCPICNCGKPNVQDCQIGESGTCSDNPLAACTVQGTGPFGPTSNDCPPNPGTNVSGGGLDILFDPVTTGTVSFPSDRACTAPGFTHLGCWCQGQTRPNDCNTACDGGANDGLACTVDADCPGAPAGACKPLCRQIAGEPVGEGECVAGPVDQRCAGASELGCSETQPCPLGLGPCVSDTRRCFLDPIVREGAPSTSVVTSVSTFCIPATSSPAVNNTAGLPGPGAIRYPNAVDAKFCGDGVRNRPQEECDGADDANCPGACAPNCLCTTECGNGAAEFGEQCDPGGPGGSPPPDDDACPALCAPAGDPDECTCPPLCGDGFVGPGEECDPGGIGGAPPADAACPGECLVGTCQCPPPVCGNGRIEAGEICELPDVGCGPLQLCVLCQLCAP